MNPLREIRLREGLTQKQVAIAAGITSQVVLKSEQGLYGMVPPKLLSTIADLTPCSESSLEAAYKEWQRKTRLSNHHLIRTPVAGSGQLTYAEFRKLVGGSVAGFCKILCLHPAQWTRLETKGGDDSFLKEALKEAGLECLTTRLH